MPREHNFLLGRGEQLASPVPIRRSGGEKNPPYDFGSARARIATRVGLVVKTFRDIRDDAFPNDEAVAVLTMHPRYVSKSDYPIDLLNAVGLRTIGSRSVRVAPEAWGVEDHPESSVTEELFVAGSRRAFLHWSDGIEGWSESNPGAATLGHIEDLKPFDARTKVRALPEGTSALLEVVVHNAGSEHLVQSFIRYAGSLGGVPVTRV